MRKFDFSNNSTNPYTVGPRHGIIPRCIMCHEDSEITFDGDEYYRYFVMGDRNALNSLDKDQKEIIISGTHPDCWDEMVKGEDL